MIAAMFSASLGMYDLPEARRATDAWWSGIASALREEGVAGVPDRLTRFLEPQAHWRDPTLLLSQSCGYPLTHAFADALQPVATPCYAAPGCVGPDYVSVVVVAHDNRATSLGELRGRVVAYNRADSHSGYNALRAMVAPLAGARQFFSDVVQTGSHERSVAAVASGRADVAAIDCVSLALLKRFRPADLDGTRELCHSSAAPGLPLVTRAQADADLVKRLQGALRRALADPHLAACREALLISDLALLDTAAYAPIRGLDEQSTRLGYPELA